MTEPALTPEAANSIIEAAPAPRVTKDAVLARIASVSYLHHDLLTICVLHVVNGFTVTGESACASKANFNAEVGERLAYDAAVAKLWMLEGYLLKERLHQAQTAPVSA